MNAQRPMMILAFLGIMCAALPITGSADAMEPTTEHESWIQALNSAVLMAREWDSDPDGTKYAPYLGQLRVIQADMLKGDEAAVYASMNRFMDMLSKREHGIAPALADWLFDYCLAVTPPKYHDLVRHIRHVAAPVAWAPAG